MKYAIGSWMSEIKSCGLPSTNFDSSINWECVGHAMQAGFSKFFR